MSRETVHEMENAQHTEGPWKVAFSPIGYGKPPDEAVIFAPRGDGDLAIAVLDHDMGEWEQNAHLIAAAPELVHVLLDMLSAGPCIRESPDQSGDLGGRAVAVLQKARIPGTKADVQCPHCIATIAVSLLE